jgi:ribosomal protein S18 acetylase RimI-like enzyme
MSMIEISELDEQYREWAQALLAAAGCAHLWLNTTNDNTAVFRFYKRVGFVLVALHREALRESRRLKP